MRHEGIDKMVQNMVCYCFGITADEIIKDVRENGRSMILEKIVASKRRGECRCAELNPKGG